MTKAVQRPVQLPVTDVFTFGQVLIRPQPNGGFRLCHRDDADSDAAGQIVRNAEEALDIARTDDAGNYRPLKTAPNLRHGWQMELGTMEDLVRALDLFYPARLAAWDAHNRNRLYTTPLRETLGRQTGMYRVAANISDEQADDVIARFCRSDGGCLRTILWKRDASGTLPSARLPSEKYDESFDQVLVNAPGQAANPHVPLLCQEACNLLVAECRAVVKTKVL
jgi:sirohydrochlorin cobaltochelatase